MVTGQSYHSVMALCPLVDENDQVIGYKERTELEVGDIYRVASLWVVSPEQEVLMAQRVFSKLLDPGKWESAVAGTVENKETYDENILKEAREELGITDVAFTRGPKLFVPDNGHGQGYFCQTFIARLDWPVERFRPQAEEVAAIKWVRLDDLEQEVAVTPEHFVASFAESSATLIAFIRDVLEARTSV